ncbi:MAG: hypothetical protein ABI190_02750 [Casimicrobiaceae bacterium]
MLTHWIERSLAGALFSVMTATMALASPQVVGDDACEKYAVDIESFATCEDGKVVRAEAEVEVPATATVALERPASNSAPALAMKAPGAIVATVRPRPHATGKRKGAAKPPGGRGTGQPAPAP